MVKQVWSFNAESLYGVVKLDGIKHIVSQVQLKSSLVFCVIMASTFTRLIHNSMLQASANSQIQLGKIPLTIMLLEANLDNTT